ncbi:MAG: ferritin-like domain-containing protein, partial [Allosphingosinicella sp.]
LLAFLHLSEAAAAKGFGTYRDAVGDDAETRDVFARILRDEAFHMNYTRHELARVAPEKQSWLLWKARLGRLWKLYLRFAVALGGLMGGILLTLQYFLLLPLFALAAKRAERAEAPGWVHVDPKSGRGVGQY